MDGKYRNAGVSDFGKGHPDTGFSVTCMLFGACTAATIVLGFLCVPRENSGVPAGTQAEERSLTWLWKDGTVLWVMATGLVVALIYQGLYASTLSELIRIHFGSSVTLLGGVAVGAATLGGVLQAIRWGWEPWHEWPQKWHVPSCN